MVGVCLMVLASQRDFTRGLINDATHSFACFGDRHRPVALHHGRHHRDPFEVKYCVMTDWLNPILDAIGLLAASRTSSRPNWDSSAKLFVSQAPSSRGSVVSDMLTTGPGGWPINCSACFPCRRLLASREGEPLPLKATTGRTLFSGGGRRSSKSLWTDKGLYTARGRLGQIGIAEPQQGP